MIVENNTVKAEKGYILQRKLDNQFFKERGLGYLYYINGEKLSEPYLTTPEDFIEMSIKEAYPILVNRYIREKYSLDAELAIQRQRDTKPEVFKEYFDYCEECKNKAKFDVIEDYTE